MRPHFLYLLQATINSVKEVSPRLQSIHIEDSCFLPSELRKYQKMLEPPPSAKPFTTDVDKKLEEGQKVITFLCYQSSYLKQFPTLYPWFMWGQNDVFCAQSWGVATSLSWLAFLILLLFKWLSNSSRSLSWRILATIWFLLLLFQNIRLLRTELQKLGESLQSAERACCHSTGAGKLRQALTSCDDILIKQVRAAYYVPFSPTSPLQSLCEKENKEQKRKKWRFLG